MIVVSFAKAFNRQFHNVGNITLLRSLNDHYAYFNIFVFTVIMIFLMLLQTQISDFKNNDNNYDKHSNYIT